MKIKGKILMLFIAVFIMSNLGIGIYSIRTMQSKTIEAAQEKLVSDLNLGRELLDKEIPGEWSIKDGELYKGEVAIYRNYEVVDKIGDLTGDTVTIFQGDKRVSTNVPKSDDKDNRAVDTVVSEVVASTVLVDGERYIGKAFVHDTWNQTAYEPIKNEFGEIIGIWYVGVPNVAYDQMVTEFRRSTILFNIAAIIITSLLITLVIQALMKPLIGLKKLMYEAESGDLSVEAMINGKDEFAELGQSFNSMIMGLKNQADAIEQLSKGDLDIKLKPKSSKDTLANSFNTMLVTMNKMNNEIEELIIATRNGELNKRADASTFEGTWKELTLGINEIVDAYSAPINLTSKYVKDIGQGNIPEKITDNYYGDFNDIKDNINTCIDAMNLLLSDTEHLIKNALDGKLDARANEDNHNGDYKEVVLGINSILDAVVEPVKEASSVLDEFSRGNLRVKVKGDYKGDHNAIKESLNETTEEISSYIKDISLTLEKISMGDMDNEITHEYLGDFVTIKKAINNIINVFNKVLLDISIVSDEVTSGAHNLSNSSDTLARGATDQASAVEEISMSIDQVAFEIKATSNKTTDIRKLANDVKEDVIKGSEEMNQMLEAMKEIEESSNSISQIIKVIDEISYQTNLLALNAAVEAARAGEHGKGFAIVAEEVRNLASRSSKAASETSTLIEHSIGRVKQGAEIASKTAEDLDKITNGINDVVNVITEVSTDIDNQVKAVTEINHGVHQVSVVTQVNSATAEESAAASQELSEQAKVLDDTVNKFNLKKDESLHLIKEKDDKYSNGEYRYTKM